MTWIPALSSNKKSITITLWYVSHVWLILHFAKIMILIQQLRSLFYIFWKCTTLNNLLLIIFLKKEEKVLNCKSKENYSIQTSKVIIATDILFFIKCKCPVTCLLQGNGKIRIARLMIICPFPFLKPPFYSMLLCMINGLQILHM